MKISSHISKIVFILFTGVIGYFFVACHHLKSNNLLVQSEIRSGDKTEWFTNAKYGLFIHWGLYSVAGGKWEGKNYFGAGEWLMYRTKPALKEYEALAGQFNPVKFDASEWVRFAKKAGMKYIVVTAKHHDGFAMWHSKVSKYNIVDATPFHRDFLKELSEACGKAGIKLGVYYSQYNDWHEAEGGTNTWNFKGDVDLETYFEKKVKPQIKELLTGYGPLVSFWFDQPGSFTKEQIKEIADIIHSYQPNCLVSDRIGYHMGDYRELHNSEIPVRIIKDPAETVCSVNDTWGYVEHDKNWKSTKEIIHMLVRCNGKGVNLLLNVGPAGDGSFPEMASDVLKNAGRWIKSNSVSIYGTSFSPFPDLSWGECTQRPGKLYLHVIEWPDDLSLRVPSIADNVKSVKLLRGGKKLRITKDGKDILIHLPSHQPDPVNTVLELNYEGNLNIDPELTQMENLKTEYKASLANLTGSSYLKSIRWTEEFGRSYHTKIIERWSSETDAIEWTFRAPETGLYAVDLYYSYSTSSLKREGLITIDDDEKLYFESKDTGDKSYHFQKQAVGVIRISEPGYHKISIRPIGDGDEFIKLRSLEMSPFE
jgi:alpha-L-fucosidase